MVWSQADKCMRKKCTWLQSRTWHPAQKCVCAVFHFYFWENTLQFLLTEKDEFFSFFDNSGETTPPLSLKTLPPLTQCSLRMFSCAEWLDHFLLSRTRYRTKTPMSGPPVFSTSFLTPSYEEMEDHWLVSKEGRV